MKARVLAVLLTALALAAGATEINPTYEPEWGVRIATLGTTRAGFYLPRPTLFQVACVTAAQATGCGGSAGGGSVTIGTTPITGGVDGDILYNNGGTLGGFAIYDDTGAGNGAFALRKTMTGSSATSNFFSVTGTTPTTLTAQTNAVDFQITGAGASAQILRALNVDLAAGFTGAQQAVAVVGSNANAGAGDSISGSPPNARFGVLGQATGAASSGVGVGGYAGGAATFSQGVVGYASNGTTRFGVLGGANAGGTTRVGGSFVSSGLRPTPTGSTALLADNLASTDSIFIGQDNGTAVFTIADGGSVTARSIAPESQATYDFGTSNALDWRRMYLRNGINDDDANRKGSGNMIIQGYNATTGTDQVGATLILGDGKGTGAAIPGNVTVRVTTPLATGTTLQSHQDRGIYVGKRLTLADNSVTTFLTVAMGNDTHCGGSIDFAVWADDNTNDGRQLTAGEITYTGVDKTAGAGGEDCDAALKGTNVTSLSPTNGGTVLTVTTTATTGTDLCNVRITADSDLAVVSLITLTYNVRPFGSGACTVTPQ